MMRKLLISLLLTATMFINPVSAIEKVDKIPELRETGELVDGQIYDCGEFLIGLGHYEYDDVHRDNFILQDKTVFGAVFFTISEKVFLTMYVLQPDGSVLQYGPSESEEAGKVLVCETAKAILDARKINDKKTI